MERRTFIKKSCGYCLAVSAALALGPLTSCVPSQMYKTEVIDNKVTVPKSLFADTDIYMIRPAHLGYSIALHKEKDDNYTALLMRCTHADNPLVYTGSGFSCNMHGSRFDQEGNVTKGPAEKHLRQFQTETTSENIIIKLA